MGWLKRHTLISHSSGRWKSKIKVQSHVVSGENPLGDFQAVTFSICAHRERERKTKRSLVSLFLKRLGSYHGPPPSGPHLN